MQKIRNIQRIDLLLNLKKLILGPYPKTPVEDFGKENHCRKL